MRAIVFVLAAAALGGCSNDVCANVEGTCVALRVDGNGSVGTVAITASGATSGMSTANGGITSLPLVMPVRFQKGVSGAVSLEVVGIINATLVGSGSTTVQVVDGQHTTGSVLLVSGRDPADGGVQMKDAGGGGTGGFGGGGGPPCTPATCPSGTTCDPNGSCQPIQMAPLGGVCTQDGSISCSPQGGANIACAADNICRMRCATTVDCTAMMPMTECFQFGGAGQGYCTLKCNAVPPSPSANGCASGLNCVVYDYANSITDCVQPNGKNEAPGMPCSAHEDCGFGESCYVKSGQTMGTCRGNCYNNNAPCQFPTGTCQVPGSTPHWGVCCPTGMSCL